MAMLYRYNSNNTILSYISLFFFQLQYIQEQFSLRLVIIFYYILC